MAIRLARLSSKCCSSGSTVSVPISGMAAASLSLRLAPGALLFRTAAPQQVPVPAVHFTGVVVFFHFWLCGSGQHWFVLRELLRMGQFGNDPVRQFGVFQLAHDFGSQHSS